MTTERTVEVEVGVDREVGGQGGQVGQTTFEKGEIDNIGRSS